MSTFLLLLLFLGATTSSEVFDCSCSYSGVPGFDLSGTCLNDCSACTGSCSGNVGFDGWCAETCTAALSSGSCDSETDCKYTASNDTSTGTGTSDDTFTTTTTGTTTTTTTTGTGVNDEGSTTTTTTTTTGTNTSETFTTPGSSDPCFSREDTTVCRLTAAAAVAPLAAFEQCFGGAASSQAERVPMKDLVAGDVVLSSPTAATRVLVQQHAEVEARKATMLLLEHETGTLVLTPDHVLKIDGAFQPAREAAVGGVLEPASRITKVSTVTRGIISPITLSGQLLAAGQAGAPVVATVWPEWIAPLMLSSALYPLPYSLVSAAAYLFPASVQQFYNEQLECLFTLAAPGLKGLKAAVPAPVALAILAGFDAACVGAFAAWACGLSGLVALLAVAVAAKARRAAKKA